VASSRSGALHRDNLQSDLKQPRPTGELLEARPKTSALVRLPIPHPMSSVLARNPALQQLCERLSPLAVIDRSLRLFISGCRPGDGASTLAAAFALDFSERLSLRTLLVDANPRSPTLHRVLSRASERESTLLLDGPMQIRSTGGWLDLANCCLGTDERQLAEALARCQELATHYAALVVDLGVARLDARMLPLSRESDPILLVVRYGHTRKDELTTTAAALSAAKRNVAGVILNAATSVVAQPTRKACKP
jgi:protein-tyrosine kinase